MKRDIQLRLLCGATSILLLSACGGGGGGGSGLVIPPPPPPPPPPVAAPAPVKIFANPTPETYSSVGASISGPGGNLDGYDTPDVSFTSVSTSAGDQPEIRYSAAGHYEVRMPGQDWDRLVHYRGLLNPTEDNNYFQPERVQQNYGYVVTRNARTEGYLYTELATWGSHAASRFGHMAFGSPTPAGAVPVTGTATFDGVVSGTTDILIADNLVGGYYPLPVDGTVQLDFDFGSGVLGGSMTLFLPGGMNPVELGTFAFSDTVFSAGSTTYSGRFDTAVSGQNFFLGRFMGPNATETGGAWALPFVFNQDGAYVPPDGRTHQAFGAWIARRN